MSHLWTGTLTRTRPQTPALCRRRFNLEGVLQLPLLVPHTPYLTAPQMIGPSWKKERLMSPKIQEVESFATKRQLQKILLHTGDFWVATSCLPHVAPLCRRRRRQKRVTRHVTCHKTRHASCSVTRHVEAWRYMRHNVGGCVTSEVTRVRFAARL